MEIDAQRKTRMRTTLQAVRRELEALAFDHGRKSLLLLSDGFLEDYGSELRDVAAASREANTAIYFLDARGLVAQSGQRVAPNGQRAAIGSSIRLPLDSISAVRVDKLEPE